MVSHPFLPVLRTWLSCIVSFRPSQLRSRSRSTGAHPTLRLSASSQVFVHAFRSLSFPSALAPHYSASASSFPLFHRFRLTAGFFGFSVPLSLLCLSPSSRPGFPCHLSGSKYSAFCSFPFVLPCFAPTAVPQVLPFWISPRGSTLGFRSLSIPSALASHYSAFCFSFPDFPRSPHSWLPGSSVSPLGSPAFFRFLRLVSHAHSPVLQYSAICLFPFVLPCFAPTAVPQVLAFFRLSASLRHFPCIRLSFVRSMFRFRLLSPLFLPFPSSRLPLTVVLFGVASVFRLPPIHHPSGLFPCLRSGFGTWLSCSSLSRSSTVAPQVLLQIPASFFRSTAAPLAFALGSGTQAGLCTLKTEHRYLFCNYWVW